MSDPGTYFNRLKRNYFTLSFSKSVEKKFYDYYFTHYILHIRIAFIVAIMVWSLFGLMDKMIAPDIFNQLCFIRYVNVLPVFLIIFIFSFFKSFKSYMQLCITIGLIASCAGLMAMQLIGPSHITTNWYVGLILLFYGYLIMGARFVWALPASIFIILSYEYTSITLLHTTMHQLINNNFFLLTAMGMGVFASYYIEHSTRKEFVQAQLLKIEKNKIYKMNKQLHFEVDARKTAQNKLRIYNKNLENIIEQRTKELHNTQQEIVYKLGNAAEYKDTDTGQHIKRIAHYSVLLGRALKMDEFALNLLFHASQMHDVGKIGIPDSILLKPGSLNDEEWLIMKKHPEIGSDLLSGNKSKLLMMANIVALTHHEKWDGSGYPKGLKENSIPLVGRIVCICDVFDALVSRRPYKDAWRTDDAIKEINNLKNAYFDPQIVDVFNDLIPEIIEIRENFHEV